MGDDFKRQTDELKEKIEALKARIQQESNEKPNALAIKCKGAPAVKIDLKTRRQLKGHFGKIYSMHWSEKTDMLVSASQDGKLIVWNANSTNKVSVIPLRSSWVMTCAFSQDDRFVACGGLDNLCTIYNVVKNETNTAKPHRELSQHEGYLSSCRFIGSEQLVTSSGDSSLILWDVEGGKPITQFTDHTGDVMSVSLTPEAKTSGSLFVSGSCDATCRLWDSRLKHAVMIFSDHESDVNAVQFFPDGQAFGTGSDDSSCRLFDIRSARQINRYSNELIVCGITSVGFSKHGHLLFAGYDDYGCYGWDVRLGDKAGQLAGHENRVSCLGVHPSSGKAVATGSWDMLVRIWA